MLLLAGLETSGQPQVAAGYNLFHRVPKELMRKDMETDRPDVTETPYTVDAGHIQFESDLVRYKSAGKPEEHTYQYLFAPFTLKLGLSRQADIQVALESYRREYHDPASESEEHYGNCGSLSFRFKHNITGNDSGRFAIAVMPYVKLPANAFFEHHKPEGGLIFPAQLKVQEKLSIGFQEEVDIVAEDEDYELQGLQSLALSYDIVKQLKAIGETYCVYHFAGHKIENYANVALQFFPTDNFALDGGMIYGFQQGAEHHYYVGISWRW